jgi:hypothetical protein
MTRQQTKGERRRQRQEQKMLAEFPLSSGQYAGRTLKSVPRAYLRWLLTAKNVSAADRWATAQYLNRRASR